MIKYYLIKVKQLDKIQFSNEDIINELSNNNNLLKAV